MPTVAPYGTWTSPLPAAAVAAGELRLGAVSVEGDDIYWVEGRPQEGGRYVLVRRSGDGTIADVTPPGSNVRTRVHEYGGKAYAIAGSDIYYSNFADQRVYRIARDSPSPAVALTPAGDWFYADFIVDAPRNRLICVREDHTRGGEAVNEIVGIALEPAEAGPHGAGPHDREPAKAGPHGAGPHVLASGYDFYSTPRLSPDGSMLAWIAWNHPRMPWDGTELWVARVEPSGELRDRTLVAGGERESIYQPGWSPHGTLYFASDRSGWWRLYRSDPAAGSDPSVVRVIRNAPPDAEFGRPEWVFGTATWGFADPSTLVVSYTRRGRWHLAKIDVFTGTVIDVAPDLQPHDWLAATSTHAVLTAGSASAADVVVRVELAGGAVETVRSASDVALDPRDISVAEAIEYPTAGGRSAHAFYYPPHNSAFAAPAGERPPLIVITHGGPTAAAKPTLHLDVQFWTTRGFAVVDVNYGGSSGYGREYRERLNGAWGIVDVDDVIHAARYLESRGLADQARVVIRGGSAGGYTTLAALTFHPGVFKAGASYYGISDLEVLELDTHKFESKYSHSLIGPYPERKDLYRERSPIHFVDRLASPLILFQGLEDKVVPPNQSQMMADALRAKGLPVAYLAFEGEQHGFRKADTVRRCLEAELYFYGAVFGFAPADAVAPVPIDNL